MCDHETKKHLNLDVPSWAISADPHESEAGREFAARLMGQKYRMDGYCAGPHSEFDALKKWKELVEK